jgi:hypothetical protein
LKQRQAGMEIKSERFLKVKAASIKFMINRCLYSIMNLIEPHVVKNLLTQPILDFIASNVGGREGHLAERMDIAYCLLVGHSTCRKAQCSIISGLVFLFGAQVVHDIWLNNRLLSLCSITCIGLTQKYSIHGAKLTLYYDRHC